MNGSHEADPREIPKLDPRLHAYLDGELSASETQAFEGELRSGSTSGDQLECLKQLRAWYRSTRPRAPSNTAQRVQATLERERTAHERADRERASAAAGSTASAPRWRIPIGPFRPRLAWIGFPAALLALGTVVVVLLIADRPDVDPTLVATEDPTRREGGIPPPPDRVGLQEPSPAPPPVIQTSRSAAPGEAGLNTVRYVFTVKADRAREICLAGDFNQWKVCDAPLARVGGDLWSITIELPRGRHEYMFVVDGRWVTDPDAMGYSDDGFGNRNALLVI